MVLPVFLSWGHLPIWTSLEPTLMFKTGVLNWKTCIQKLCVLMYTVALGALIVCALIKEKKKAVFCVLAMFKDRKVVQTNPKRCRKLCYLISKKLDNSVGYESSEQRSSWILEMSQYPYYAQIDLECSEGTFHATENKITLISSSFWKWFQTRAE